MTRIRPFLLPVLCAAVYLAVMGAVEYVLMLPYLYKSLVKVLLTLGLVGIACAVRKQEPSEVLFLYGMKPAGKLFLLMGIMFAGVWVGFLLLRGSLDLSLIRERLMAKEGLTKQNCLYVFGYIIIVNSFLEEAFFRGFLGHAFPENIPKAWGTGFAAVCFAVYHIGILDAWVNPAMLLLMIAGLAAVGAVLQLICDRFGSVKASWLVHGCANLAINTIGAAVMFAE